ncbi:MAG TPA: HAMP domain-containing sensor histidine kinase [Candidatus Udaeobacter sp.]|jgi:signal transduction histidine kinase|nr:HAMP domain-containing sensor histidine kinase [Candidatus Udaeobacter sp.]
MSAAPRFSGSQLLKASLIAGSIILVLAVFLFTQQIINRLSHEVATTSRVFAEFCAQASLPATHDPVLQQIFSEMMGGIDYPIIITDKQGTPRAWREIDLDPALVPAPSLDSVAFGRPVAPAIQERVNFVRRRVADMDKHNKPIVMMQSPGRDTLGFVHFGVPPVMERLRWMPVVSLGGVVLLLGLGLLGLASIRTAEKRTIWVGMAKETAHQLGTPLSSLMGWIELLRGRIPGDGDVRVPRAEFVETLEEMERDVERLNKVAQRFSHIGSAALLQPQDVTPTVRRVVYYMRRRLPKSGGDVEIHERYEDVPPVNLNPELLEWAVENLIANALSAIDKRPGRVDVEVGLRPESESVDIVIRDNGRGMTREEQRRAFEPGYTTRSRGWGLGLALVRRVVQDYHGGKLAIRQSVPGQGTTMVISFPV